MKSGSRIGLLQFHQLIHAILCVPKKRTILNSTMVAESGARDFHGTAFRQRSLEDMNATNSTMIAGRL